MYQRVQLLLEQSGRTGRTFRKNLKNFYQKPEEVGLYTAKKNFEEGVMEGEKFLRGVSPTNEQEKQGWGRGQWFKGNCRKGLSDYGWRNTVISRAYTIGFKGNNNKGFRLVCK